MSSSSDLSDRIRITWLVPGQTEDVVADLQDAGGASLTGLVRIATDHSSNVEIRSSAVWLLGRLKKLGPFKNNEALHPLLTVLGDPNESLRRDAAQALGVLGDRRAAAKLIQAMLGDPNSIVRQLAAQSLGALGSPKAIRALRGVLTDQSQDPSLRGATAEALGASFAFDSTPELIVRLRDRSPEVRFWSAYALGFMRAESALPELERLSSGDDAEVPGWWSVSKEAAWAIAEIRDNPPWQ
jgi:HEAT repeat protein